MAVEGKDNSLELYWQPEVVPVAGIVASPTVAQVGDTSAIVGAGANPQQQQTVGRYYWQYIGTPLWFSLPLRDPNVSF
jgi:hypothetical protein